MVLCKRSWISLVITCELGFCLSFSACVVDFAFLQGVEKSEAFEDPHVLSMSQDVLSMSSKTISHRVKLCRPGQSLDSLDMSGHLNLVKVAVCASSN